MTLIIKTSLDTQNFDSYLERKSKKANTFIVQFPVDPKDSQLLVGACRHNLFKAIQECTKEKVKVIVIPGHGAPDCYRASYHQEGSLSFDIGGLARLVAQVVGERILQVKIYSCYSGNGPNCLAARFSQYVKAPVIGFHSPIKVLRRGHVPVPETESIKGSFEEFRKSIHTQSLDPDDVPKLSIPLDLYQELHAKELKWTRDRYKQEIEDDKRTFLAGVLARIS